jgi:hypothetical protein
VKLTWHIVKKDLRRLRPWLFAWIAVLGLPLLHGVVLIYRCPLPVEHGDWTPGQIQWVLRVFEGVAGYLLAVMLFQEDAVTGSRQFWVTRPISNARLLGAKVAGALLLFVVLPITVSVPWWLWCGLSLPQMGLGALEIAAFAGIVIVPAATIAVITDSFGRALLWTFVFVALVLANVALFFSVIRGTQDHALLATRVVLCIALVVAELAAIVVLRFLVRARLWPVAFAIALVGSSVWYVRSSRWAWPMEARQLHPERAAALELGEPTFAAIAPSNFGPNESPRIDVAIPLRSLPSTGQLYAVFSEQQWSWPSEVYHERVYWFDVEAGRGDRWGLHRPPSDPETERWRAKTALEWKKKYPNRPMPRWRLVDAPVRPQVLMTSIPTAKYYSRIAATPTRFTATMWFALLDSEIAVEVPLASRSWHARHGTGVRIDRIESGPTQPDGSDPETMVILVQTRLTPFADWFFQANLSEWARYLLQQGVLINRERGELGVAEPRGKSVETVVNSVEIAWRSTRVGSSRVVRDGKWVERPGWLDGASFGTVLYRPQAIFTREVSVPQVKLQVRDERPADSGGK